MTQPNDAMEERLAHLIRQVEELSDEVARQSREIDTLNRRVAMLMMREAERESEGAGGVVMGDERPPHY
ncbi:SlyX protein [Thalassococcus halodurans]|uniref:SlyX protein n=1 Tax=Thalassococcus halodurans TaxID=373675 RepID=A0A1H5TD80_9RHOB|nr:SlyX family protein [Thalassococcus halodurans]SEF59967.1 SlyX protein [Thalassococcus halodurans]